MHDGLLPRNSDGDELHGSWRGRLLLWKPQLRTEPGLRAFGILLQPQLPARVLGVSDSDAPRYSRQWGLNRQVAFAVGRILSPVTFVSASLLPITSRPVRN